jgi:hypothetical protein
LPQGQPLQMTGKERTQMDGEWQGNFDQIATRNPDCCATTLSMTALDAVCRREAANMNREPGSKEKSETTRRPLEASSAPPDPKLLEFVKSLARAAAREDHRRAAEAALPRPEPDGQ